MIEPAQSAFANRQPQSSWAVFAQPAFRYAMFCGFVALVFLTGGGSRADITSLVILRPLAFLMLGIALVMMDTRHWERVRLPMAAIALLALAMLLQLVPLPPFLWQALPGRESIMRGDALMAVGTIWRTLSLSPYGTLNSLFSLGVPAAVLALLAIQQGLGVERLILPVLVAGACSLVLGFAQISGPSQGPLYLYEITNKGAAVGLFANRNHNAMFLATLVPLVIWFGLKWREGRAGMSPVAGLTLTAAAVTLMMLGVLATGSRSGFVLALMAFGLSALCARAMVARGGDAQRPGKLALVGIGVVPLAVLGTLTALRATSIDRFLDRSLDQELRWQVLPHVAELAELYFPFGSGFGSFDKAYRMVEPPELLGPAYLNHAHNDALQIVVEAGAFGVLILLVTAGLLIAAGGKALKAIRRFRLAERDQSIPVQPFATIALLLLLAGSATDYPLRVPSLMLLTALLGFLSLPRAAYDAGKGSKVDATQLGISRDPQP